MSGRDYGERKESVVAAMLLKKGDLDNPYLGGDHYLHLFGTSAPYCT
jgi:hypothetical protein